jgi:TolB protein
MMQQKIALMCGILGVLSVARGQQPDVKIEINKLGAKPALAVADLRGAGAAQPLMNIFNQTLYNDLDGSGLFKMVPKGMMPINVPQQPSDFRGQTAPEPAPTRGGQPGPPAQPTGYYLSDWSGPPAQAGYLAFGYTAVQNNVLTLYGWLYNVTQPMQGAQVIAKRYFGGDANEASARKIAHDFAADIIAQFGGTSLVGTHIYFVSDRTGAKEIWSMDPDGANQKQITKFHSISIQPAISPDGTKLAFTSFAKRNPAIFVFSVETGRALPFYNQVASLNATPNFTTDGQHIVYSSTAAGGDAQLYIANLDGTDFKRISYRRAIEVEPKVNPKTGSDLLFVSGPGPQQVYRMDMSGANVEMVSPGGGEASNPSWHPDGQIMAFSWTRGFATGAFNIFIMDIASRNYNQLTHNEGRNENPTWAPDGRHLVFQSNRRGGYQLWSMLADGTDLKQLTTQGQNYSPVWGK